MLRRLTVSRHKYFTSFGRLFQRSTANAAPPSRHLSSPSDTNVSSLYVSGKIGQHTSSVVTDTNIDQILQNTEKFKKDLKLRGLAVNLDRFLKSYRRMVELNEEIINIEKRRVAVRNEMNANLSGADDKEIEGKLRAEAKSLKRSLKSLMDELYSVEEYVVMTALGFPNKLEEAASVENVVVKESGLVETRNVRPHMDLVGGQVVFKPTSPNMAYLRDDLAILEQAITNYFSDRLLSAGFTSVIAPDIFRTLVVEGCAQNLDDLFKLEIKESDLSKASGKALEFNKLEHSYFLTGPSAMSLSAFFTRCITAPESLPLRFLCPGRRYKPRNSSEKTLFNLNQTSGINLFLVGTDESMCRNLHEESRDLLWKIYNDLDLPLKLVRVGVRDLGKDEISRFDIECYYPALKEYKRVGSTSRADDYISRRLMMRMGGKEAREEFRYLHVVHSDALNVQRLMALIIENHFDGDRIRIPDCILEHWLGPIPADGIKIS